MIKNNQDLYESLGKLIKDLKSDLRATKFQDAMEVSCVPGEILGQIRVELKAFLKTSENPAFRERAEALKKYLDEIL